MKWTLVEATIYYAEHYYTAHLCGYAGGHTNTLILQ